MVWAGGQGLVTLAPQLLRDMEEDLRGLRCLWRLQIGPLARIDRHRRGERVVNWAARGYVEQSAPLLIRQIPLHRDRKLDSVQLWRLRSALRAIVRMNSPVRKTHVDTSQGPLTMISVHLDRNGSARAQRCEQQLIRTRTGIPTAGSLRFVRAQRMRADRYVLNVLHGAYAHDNGSRHATSAPVSAIRI
jgi:hypothetical protein